ncbi:MAG: Ethanolamine utilization protein-like protein [Caldanaerobacter subterraneus]|nr:MAG: Ethanolamine utilization protein-like protein [Caldanaerobacter subterraneus]
MSKKIVFVGPVGAGKSTLIANLRKSENHVLKTQTITYMGEFVDIPGEYIEIRKFNYAVINEILSAKAVVIVQDATSSKWQYHLVFAVHLKAKKSLE